jgi:hypothetical protein
MSVFQAWLSAGSLRHRVRALEALSRGQRASLLPSGNVAARRYRRDVGANKGSFTYWLSRWVGDGLVARSNRSLIWRAISGHLPPDRACQCDGRSQGGLLAFRQRDSMCRARHQPGASLQHIAAENEEFSVLRCRSSLTIINEATVAVLKTTSKARN